MTDGQKKLYNKLRNKLIHRGILAAALPTAKKIEHLDNQKIYMIIKVFSEEVKNLDAWEYSHSFREAFFRTYDSIYTIKNIVYRELKNVFEYAGFYD